MNYEEIKEIARTMSKKDFKEKYCHNDSEGKLSLLISNCFYYCPDDIYKDDKGCYFNCQKCWLKFIDDLYDSIKIKEHISNVQEEKPLKLTQKYFIGDTELKEGMKLRIQNEDPYENKFEHMGTVKKELDKLYLKEDDSEIEFPLDDYSIKILEIINE